MRRYHRSPSPTRRAFTLVEMIVVIAIVVILAGLAVLLIPQLQDNQHVVSAADQLSGTLLLTRQWARRDQLPRGVRLNLALDSAGLMRVHTIQIMEQPDYFVSSPTMAIIGMTNPNGAPDPGGNLPNTFLAGGIITVPTTGQPVVNIDQPGTTFVDFYGGYGPGKPPGSQLPLWPVQPGDYLDLMGNNKSDGLFKIITPTAVLPTGGVLPSKNPTTLTVSDNLIVQNVPQTTLALLGPVTPAHASIVAVYPNFQPFQNPIPFRILRGPRPMPGQQPINLATDIVVDYPDPPPLTFPFNLPPGPPGQPLLPHPPQLELLVPPQAGWPTLTPPQVYGSIVPLDSQTGQVDIMFAPSGKVIRDAGNNGKIVLWLYDTSDPVGGAMTLVTVYTRTGTISVHPVNISQPDRTNNNIIDPYAFVRDGRSSGM
jgi:prepilin-type N-terminal cleavage/methylation domain-containing protein